MTIRKKIVSGLIFLSVAVIIASFGGSHYFILRNYIQLELQLAEKEMSRILNIVNGDISDLGKTAINEAQWDAAYQFALNPSSEFIESDMMYLPDIGLDLIIYTNISGEVIYARHLSQTTGEEEPLPEEILSSFIQKENLFANENTSEGQEGLIDVSGRPFLLSSQPILKSDGSGPVAGTLLIGRWLDGRYAEELGNKAENKLTLVPFTPDRTHMAPMFTAEVSDKNKQVLIGKAFLRNLSDDLVLPIEAELDRSVYSQGKKNVNYFLICFIFGTILSALLIYFFIHKWLSSQEYAKDLQAKAIKAGQLATVGELTTMIAHEVNNPLSGVIGCAEVSLNNACKDCHNKNAIQRIVSEGERIAKLVRGLLSFTYRSDGEQGFQEVEPIINNSILLIDGQAKKNDILIDVKLPEKLPQVKCNPQQIEQVLVNILRNAYQALLEGTINKGPGKIIIVEASSVKKSKDNYLQIKTSNNGPNIDGEIIERIYEPFYTTKPAGIGSGLGLSISMEIMKSHGGLLEVRSEIGDFTEIALLLPIDN